MKGGVLAFILAGFVGFGAGAYLAATGQREVGIILMGGGLVFQMLALRQIRMIKKDGSDAGR